MPSTNKLMPVQQKLENTRRRQEKEAEEAAVQQLLKEDKEKLERQEREMGKKAQSLERREEEEHAKEEEKTMAAQAKADEAKHIFAETRDKAFAETRAQKASRKAATTNEKDTAPVAAAAAVDKPSGNINDLLQDLSRTEGMMDVDEDSFGSEDRVPYQDGQGKMPEEERDWGNLPDHKKSKQEKRADTKAAKRALKQAAKAQESKENSEKAGRKSADGPVLILKQSKSTEARITSARKQYVHKFRRQIVDTLIVLYAPGGRKDKMTQFSVALKSLMANCILVDEKF